MNVDKLSSRLWRWTAYHSEWKEEVSCWFFESEDGIVLFDPLIPAEGADSFLSALDRDVERGGSLHILITVFWHARSSRELAERYPGARVWALRRAAAPIARRTSVTDRYRLEDRLPGGVRPLPTGRSTEVCFWIPSERSLIVGDAILGADSSRPLRFCPESWLPEGRTHDDLREAFSPIADLDLRRLLVSHGRPLLRGGRRSLAALCSGTNSGVS